MKQFLPIIIFVNLVFPLLTGAQSTYFISTTGNDKNAGDKYRPFATWEYINTLVKDGRLKPGDTVFIRGGVYQSWYGDAEANHVLWRNIHGSPGKPISIMAFPGETPILGLDDIMPQYENPVGLKVEQCSYLHIKGLRVSGLAQVADGSGLSRGIEISHTSQCIFEQLEIDHIGGYGLLLGDNTVESMFLNMDVHHIYDSLTIDDPWKNANGIHVAGTTSDKDTFRFCRVWKCSDDGFDFNQANGNFVLDGCWAFWNGYKPYSWDAAGGGSGFKLVPQKTHAGRISKKAGSAERILSNCLAFENREIGFNQENGGFKCILHNNTSYMNGDGRFGYGFLLTVNPQSTQDLKNNISFRDYQATQVPGTVGINNSWNLGYEVSVKDFMSVSSDGVDGFRKPDGSLPELPFLRFNQESALYKSMATEDVVAIGATGAH